MILPVTLVTPRKNKYSSSASGCLRLIFDLRERRGKFDLVALIVPELERCGFDLEALDTLDKPAPIRAAAEFAVRHNLQAHLLLQGDDIADALVLQFAEFGLVDLRQRHAGETPDAMPAAAAGFRRDRHEMVGGLARAQPCGQSP